MKQDTKQALAMLEVGSYTCVVCKGDIRFSATERGVKPLLNWLEGGTDLRGFCAADKVVGKATAMLYRLLQVQEVYAAVISDAALQTLEDGNIRAFYGTRVPHIINRTGDGCCPMESATAHIRDPREALEAIEHTLVRLRSTP